MNKKHNRHRLWFLSVFLCLTLSRISHGEVLLEGHTAIVVNGFKDEPGFDNQCCRRLSSAVELAPRIQYWNDSPWSANLSVYYQRDLSSSLGFGDINESSVTYNADSWSLLMGIGEVYWGVTEAYQPNNVINQYDGRRGLGYDEKIGQAMVHYQYWPEWGEVHAFLLPWHRARSYRKTEQRLSTNKPVDDDPVYTDGKQTVDLAARAVWQLDAIDLSLNGFKGNSREPRLIEGSHSFQQQYANVTHLGMDVQWTLEDVLLKFDGARRWGEGSPYVSLATGVEYSLYDVQGLDGQMGLIVEYIYDDRSDDAPSTLYNNDVFLGVRWEGNDVNSTEMLLSGLFDLEKKLAVLSADLVQTTDRPF